ncbi:TPA: WG repeat-containing protein [Campylobacter coli]|nr:WG repeat-containing protein [Campylobacter coli]
MEKKLGLFDIKSKQFILEPKLDDIYNFSDNLLQVSLQGKQGVFDIKNRRFIIEPKLDTIYYTLVMILEESV